MKNIQGAQRPTSTCNVLWIAVVAIFLVVATAAAAFSEYTGDPYFGMGSDNVMGMMPPNGMYGSTSRQTARTQLAQRSVTPVPVLKIPPRCAPSGVLTAHQSFGGKSYTYTSTKKGCVYTIARDGRSLFTVTYDSSSHTYKLTDPNGSRELLLELGIAPGQFHAPYPKRISR
jgi:hypothetical protein